MELSTIVPMPVDLSKFRLISLRSRLMLLVALAITPLAAMTVINGIRERDHAVRVSEENLLRLTRLAAASRGTSSAECPAPSTATALPA